MPASWRGAILQLVFSGVSRKGWVWSTVLENEFGAYYRFTTYMYRLGKVQGVQRAFILGNLTKICVLEYIIIFTKVVQLTNIPFFVCVLSRSLEEGSLVLCTIKLKG